MSLPKPPTLTAQHALFLDFDGTLAPLQDYADLVRLETNRIEALLQLSDRRDGALAIISGRDIRDLASRTPDGLLRVGNHGLYEMPVGETLAPDLDALPETLETALKTVVGFHPGTHLEIKGPVGTIHYRACPDRGPMVIEAVKTAVGTHHDYRCKTGNHVVEAIPLNANKGLALERLMAEPPFHRRIPVMVGDDTTDEDGFLAAQRLGGFGVKVGDAETVARKRLASVDDVWSWLETSLES